MLKWNSHVSMDKHRVSFLTKTSYIFLAILVSKLLASDVLRHFLITFGEPL